MRWSEGGAEKGERTRLWRRQASYPAQLTLASKESVVRHQNMLHDFQKLEDNIHNRLHIGKPRESEEELDISKWDEWNSEIHNDRFPNAFGFLELARDSGFSEVKGLYHHHRWASAAMLIAFVLFNVVQVIRLDYAFISDPQLASEKLGTQLETIDKFYFTRMATEKLWPHVAPWIGYDPETPSPSPVQVIGALELLGLIFFVCDFLYCCGIAAHAHGFRKWYAIQRMCWDILPTLSVYSAMRLLNAIVPAVITATSKEYVGLLREEYNKSEGWRSHKETKAWLVGQLFAFGITLIFSTIVGFDTFLMKLRVVSAAADRKQANLHALACTMQFLVQLIGVVRLGTLVRRRLFIFIFGGEDAVLQEHEIVLMDTWNSLLAKRMFKELGFYEFIAVILTFTDEDFQSLVFNETEDEAVPQASVPVHSVNKKDSTRSIPSHSITLDKTTSVKSLPESKASIVTIGFQI